MQEARPNLGAVVAAAAVGSGAAAACGCCCAGAEAGDAGAHGAKPAAAAAGWGLRQGEGGAEAACAHGEASRACWRTTWQPTSLCMCVHATPCFSSSRADSRRLCKTLCCSVCAQLVRVERRVELAKSENKRQSGGGNARFVRPLEALPNCRFWMEERGDRKYAIQPEKVSAHDCST